MIRRTTPHTTQVVQVTITDVDLDLLLVHCRDKIQGDLLVNMRDLTNGMPIPKVGDLWTIERIGYQWHLRDRLVTESDHTAIKGMAQGDVRIASTGVVHLVGSSILFNGAPVGTGASAYDIAVAHGFVGTETAWLASLVGPPGSGGGSTPTVVTANSSETIVATDEIVLCDVTGGAIGITLPASPGTNEQHWIKDASGHAGANPITVNGNGHLIDGGASAAVNINWQSIHIIFHGTDWFIL